MRTDRRDPGGEPREGHIRQEPSEREGRPGTPVLLVETQIQQTGSPGGIHPGRRRRSAGSNACAACRDRPVIKTQVQVRRLWRELDEHRTLYGRRHRHSHSGRIDSGNGIYNPQKPVAMFSLGDGTRF